MQIRHALQADLPAVMDLAADLMDPLTAGPLIRSHAERHHLLVADEADQVIGALAYRTDFFQCTFVSWVGVRREFRRRGVARALFRAVEEVSPSPRLFSAVDETDAVGIRLHSALGFAPSGHIDNLPQGYRELLFYKRRRP
ncbi:MAG TPA: GNAT family N-acetyltransferase [Calidithermus sp.]|jgi:GNAT superfamily N-acetyltransferase|nr:GNAT family N-acetyltransferase [Calidithermus sp.]